jgi:hypothetical protein
MVCSAAGVIQMRRTLEALGDSKGCLMSGAITLVETVNRNNNIIYIVIFLSITAVS